jgi:hypothetical protein
MIILLPIHFIFKQTLCFASLDFPKNHGRIYCNFVLNVLLNYLCINVKGKPKKVKWQKYIKKKGRERLLPDSHL